MKKHYDVIVAGGGIPGLYAARELATRGYAVALFESSENPELPNYSTAGIPTETLNQFNLPKAAVNAPIWHQIIGNGTREVHKTAKNKAPLAYVLDFGKTKRLLRDECQAVGVSLYYGEKILSAESLSAALPQKIITTKGSYSASNVLDASGSGGVLVKQRGLREGVNDRPTLGMEYRIESSAPTWTRFRNTIAIYFDAELLPHGYGWVFADGPNTFKVGLIEYWTHPSRRLRPLEQRLKKFIVRLGGDLNDVDPKVIEKHGGLKIISKHFNKVRDGRLFGIGDSIGAINPFLAEGIRQGLVSAQFAVEAIVKDDPSSFERRWQSFKGPRWRLAELFAELCYASPNADFTKAIVETADKLSSDELRRLVFLYEFEILLKRAPLQTIKALWPLLRIILNNIRYLYRH
jgi:flavin-dependent dehydrogenase